MESEMCKGILNSRICSKLPSQVGCRTPQRADYALGANPRSLARAGCPKEGSQSGRTANPTNGRQVLAASEALYLGSEVGDAGGWSSLWFLVLGVMAGWLGSCLDPRRPSFIVQLS